ncbi:MAG: hypothetical protein ACRC67_40980 [Inquilinus sp.]|uniref:hypothetical protein n=1 Tax=Inquilinus sp. TaxID=1932117 RepID=UPI003F356A6C
MPLPYRDPARSVKVPVTMPRSRLARAVGRDLPIALLEDAVAIGVAAWIVTSV